MLPLPMSRAFSIACLLLASLAACAPAVTGVPARIAPTAPMDVHDFDGLYVADSRHLDFAGTQIEGGVIRFGAGTRAELAPVEGIERGEHELLFVAIWHEDIDDPGDASTVYVLLRDEGGGRIRLSFGDSPEEVRDEPGTPLTRVEGPLPGLAFRPSHDWLGLPMPGGLSERCTTVPELPLTGTFRLDVDALPRGTDLFATNLRDAWLVALSDVVSIGEGGLFLPSARTGLCVESLETVRDGRVEGSVEVVSLEAPPVRARFRIDSTETGIVLRVVPEGGSLADALPLPFVRTGEFEPVDVDPCSRFVVSFHGLDDEAAIVELGPCRDTDPSWMLTRDGGRSYAPLEGWSGGYIADSIALAGHWFLVGEDGVYRSSDRGRTFHRIYVLDPPTTLRPAPEGELGRGHPRANPARLFRPGPDALWVVREESVVELRGRSLVGRVPRPVQGRPVVGARGSDWLLPGAHLLRARDDTRIDAPRFVETFEVPGEAPRAREALSARIAGADVALESSCVLHLRRDGSGTWETVALPETHTPGLGLVADPNAPDRFVGACGDFLFRGDTNGRVDILWRSEIGLYPGFDPIVVGHEVWFVLGPARATAAGLAVEPDGTVRILQVPPASEWPRGTPCKTCGERHGLEAGAR